MLNRFRGLILVILLTGSVVFLNTAAVPSQGGEEVLAASYPVIAAAGDIACDPASTSFNGGNGTSAACRQKHTSNLLVNAGLAAVLPLGDIQYRCGGYEAFLESYDLSWGRVKDITRPAIGNHEYLTSGGGTGCTSSNDGAAGYFSYFGAAAGEPGKGYYSYDIGDWHLIALNSNCTDAGGCGPTSPQGKWLLADLAANTNGCTLAYWHIPLFSSGGRAETNSQEFWRILYDHDVDVILNGHDHIYERFAPQDPSGLVDPIRGIRQFTVGTGGNNHTSLESIAANSEVRNTDTFGVLKLTLRPTGYNWQFVPEAGATFTDSGSQECHGAGLPPVTGTATPTAVPTPAGADIRIEIGTMDEDEQRILEGESRRLSYRNIDQGPVHVRSLNAMSLIAGERVIYRVSGVPVSFSEMMALPDSQLHTTYWLPWYNNIDLDTQLRFANVSSSTASVRVYIGGDEMPGSPFTLKRGQSLRRSFRGIDRGPVKIVSNVKIVAAQRVIYHVGGKPTSFSEMMALPDSQLHTTYWLPWYNNIDLDTQLRFANVSSSTASVRVYIGGDEMPGSPFSLKRGQSLRRSFRGIDRGPVRIVSNVKIVAAERVIYRVGGKPTSFSEIMGLPSDLMDTAYWLPWYNNIDLDTQLRLGVP